MGKVRGCSLRFDLSVGRFASGAEGCVPQRRLCARVAGLRKPWGTPVILIWPADTTKVGGWGKGVNGRGEWGVGSRGWGWCCWLCSLATVDRWGSDAEVIRPWARSVVFQPLPSSDERGGLVAGFRPAFTWGGGRENGVSGFWGVWVCKDFFWPSGRGWLDWGWVVGWAGFRVCVWVLFVGLWAGLGWAEEAGCSGRV